jgi:hypothetical protein
MKEEGTQLVSPLLAISPNCYLQGDRLISYRTAVGTVVGGTLYANGTYSRTTGKHLYKAAEILGVILVKKAVRPEFDMFELGVKLRFEYSLVSTKGSVLIINLMKEGHDLTCACAFAWKNLNRQDRQSILSTCESTDRFLELVKSTECPVEFIMHRW